MSLHTTACPLDCPDACSLTVEVRSGRLVSVDATPVDTATNPLTGGFICHKVKRHADRVHGPDRVLTPLIRSGPKGSGTFRPASWDEAMELVAQRLREAVDAHGPSSVVPYLYNSSGGVLAASTLGLRVCAELGFAHLQHTICAATLGAAKLTVLGGMDSADPLDLEHSRHIVVWGANPTISNTHLPPLVTTAVRSHGARLVVVDPRRTAMAARAHRHLALRPGTDVVLAAAMARHLEQHQLIDRAFLDQHASGVDQFLAGCQEWTLARAADVTGVAASDIAATAEEWAAASPSMLRIGWGMERNRNGGPGCTTVLALPILMGHFGQLGSGIVHSTSSGNGVDAKAITGRPTLTPSTRLLSQNRLGQALDPKAALGEQFVSALIVQGANPALMNLDQTAVLRGLEREDLFTMVHEQVMTDTARWADVVLPATTHYEAADLADSYGSYLVQDIPAVIDRVGESRTNNEVWADLGERLGITGLDPDPDVLKASVLTPRPIGSPAPRRSMVQMVDVFPGFPDRRFRLVPISYVHTSLDGDPDHPLTLLSPAGGTTINSVFGERRTDLPTVSVHPDDAATRNIVDGQRVVLHNHLARIELVARINQEVRPGVVSVLKGYWSRAYHQGGLAINALIPAEVEPMAGGACFNDARVQLSAIG